MLRLFAALAAVTSSLVAWPQAAGATTTQLFPGVTYESATQFTLHGPVAIKVIRGPKPVGLYRLRTVLSNETVLGRETVSSMQRRRAAEATMVGVNADFARFSDGKPSGITLRDGVLVTRPYAQRSSLGIGLDGMLDVRRVSFVGTWRGTGQPRTLNEFNDVPERNGVSLFTSDWGRATPQVSGALSVVLSPFPASVPNAELAAPVVSMTEDAPTSLTPGSAVLMARGSAAAKLRDEAAIGTNIALRLGLQPEWGTVSDAVGGGPVIVRDGQPVYDANEAFTVSQIAPRHPRTAVGQLANGRLVMVVVDGRQPGYSVGMTTYEMALTMRRLGAVRAIQLDSGGSSTLAFDGTVLNTPSDGRERPIGSALMLEYYGVFAPPPVEEVVSPNGDGVAERQRLSFRIVRPSSVSVELTAPDGSTVWSEIGQREPGAYAVAFPPPRPAPLEGEPAPQPDPPAEGRWTLTVNSTDDQGLGSSATRRFSVNSTLASLAAAPTRVVVRNTGGRVLVRWTQARAARVRLAIETPQGIGVRTVSNGTRQAGEQTAVWDGRAGNRKPVAGGRYVVRVVATNELGVVSLAQGITVRRVKR